VASRNGENNLCSSAVNQQYNSNENGGSWRPMAASQPAENNGLANGMSQRQQSSMLAQSSASNTSDQYKR